MLLGLGALLSGIAGAATIAGVVLVIGGLRGHPGHRPDPPPGVRCVGCPHRWAGACLWRPWPGWRPGWPPAGQ